jgi:hypothetical protein
MGVTSTLAYYEAATITELKSFIVQDPVVLVTRPAAVAQLVEQLTRNLKFGGSNHSQSLSP